MVDFLSHRHFREQFGAYGSNVALQASFFAAQWKLVEPTLDLSSAAIIFVETGGSLLAVTRLAEAEEALDAGLKLLGTNLADENTVKYASRLAVDLSKVRVVRGDLKSAVTVGEKSVQLANLTADTSFRVPARTTLANALHQTGRLSDAEVFFKRG